MNNNCYLYKIPPLIFLRHKIGEIQKKPIDVILKFFKIGNSGGKQYNSQNSQMKI
ncbi:MAG: hypothetical protein ABIC36_00070 [bacterium]